VSKERHRKISAPIHKQQFPLHGKGEMERTLWKKKGQLMKSGKRDTELYSMNSIQMATHQGKWLD